MSLCPSCNGMEANTAYCPRCSTPMDDVGKASDFYGPYSPYREIDHLHLTNGFLDVEQHICLHLAFCPNCGHEKGVIYQELEENP